MKNILSKTLILSACLMLNSISIGAEALSFEDAYTLMIKNNKGLKAASKVVEEKKYKKRAAMGHFLPSVGLNMTYAHLDEEQGFNFFNMSIPVQK